MKRLIFVAAIIGSPVYAQSQYPFEGRWVNPDKNCSTSHTEYTKSAVTTVYEPAASTPPDVCKISAVKPAGKSFIVQMRCKDDSGDGPSTFKITEKITLLGPDKLTKTSSVFEGKTFNMSRCPK